jgi:anti-sigma factor RsiW
MTDLHLTSETLAAHLDRALERDERERVERHLAGCITCRAELREIEAMLRATPGSAIAPARRRSTPRRFALPATVGIAAALLVFVLSPRRADTPVVRDGAAAPAGETSSPVVTVVPPRGATVGASALTLGWRSVAADANYHVALVDSVGRALWSTRTGDTTAVVPADVVARTAGRVFWYVDALRPDGHSATSGMTELRIAR